MKAEARQKARAIRSRASAESPGAAIALLETFPAELGRLTPVGGYWPVGSEIDPRVLMGAFAQLGMPVALPRMESRTGPPRFLVWRSGATLSADAFGVPSPPPNSEEVLPRLLLTPLLAFDRGGGRLGQGGGHYDRILARLRPLGTVAVGVAFAAQELPLIPTGMHDEPLDWVVTEREAIRCR